MKSETVWDEADGMCPRCVTPWKCNGPHLMDKTPWAERQKQGTATPVLAMPGEVQLVMERDPRGGYVVLAATPVHTHACPSWRIGKRHGPCDCGAVDVWARQQPKARRIIEGAVE